MAGRAVPLIGEKAKLLAGVLTLHLMYSWFHIFSRAALDMGMGKAVFMVYRSVLGLILLAPFAYLLEKDARPRMTLSVAVLFFATALIMTMSQELYILGLYYLSPTFVSAIQNSIPAFTFALAAALRLEQVNIKKIHGVAKLVGMVASIGGATIITLYKGTPLLHGSHNGGASQLLGLPSPLTYSLLPSSLNGVIRNWKLGCFFLVAHCLTWAIWMVLQVPLLKKYPAKLSVSAITTFFAVIQFLVVAAFADRDVDRWKIHSIRQLLSTLYAGVVWSGFGFALQIWCIGRGGPLYVAVFQPLQTVAVAVLGICISGEQLYTGGIIGAGTITIGLYLVIWGKSKETVPASREQLEESHITQPLIVEDEHCRHQQKGESLA